ncbi:hypothetical protein [Spongiactinospora sp. 9N601]|uniref:hypothetical protein n=1 Tax=Spongiactinospora sp. 9N601 TaxID=3375149 RepID=UPI0037B6CD34
MGGRHPCNDDPIACLTLRSRARTSDEIGIVGHGPAGSILVAGTADLRHQWDRRG